MTCRHCDRPIHGRGLCKMHYNRLLRHGDPVAPASLGGGVPDGFRAFVEAQRYRSERPAAPCFHCGASGLCEHRREAA